MLKCSFELNNKTLSKFICGSMMLDAFSGLGSHKNQRSSACIKGLGPIPPGEYYILDRQSGGRLRWLRDMLSFSDKNNWFALYAIDNKIDDYTYCELIRRGQFMLHAKGPLGISKGCITIDKEFDYLSLYNFLKRRGQVSVPKLNFKVYGIVKVI